MGAIKTLRYPKKSHRKKVTIPKRSKALAEFHGIMLGDGGIGNPWQATITLNATKDREYARYIQKLVSDLFALAPVIIKSKDRDALRILINSTTTVDFLVSSGLSRGNKLAKGLRIPKWILAKPSYRLACVRGLVDTDGCIFIHKHVVAKKLYRNIGLTFSSRSPELIFQVAAILGEFKIVPHITMRGTDIYLYQADAVARYLEIFGSSNTRITSVYEQWRGDRAA
ncbi:hypothetical protein COU19_02165 [Candidatus Kaiserbacteria bacterium CG10_big_fil_rev_8_21_14_0_10_56_12]|uniref:DOD-type homing endonuclease domain-containing protein n=1 Tax=Candidatus Kaiserbacteria bacterium CG10_big_fil_rev_8_21_14_0_10_56_12 TaxID=1974611 RepID=A0A2H0U9U6_9BACT|nr:MAG: hypothetical protein COU19_02165 [Candidatus Kaiserbacteria bacterium CG10_big_fil_rev_8_21_14_0_10_56_12]